MKYIKNVAKIEIHSDKCIGCGLCVNVCPHTVISMKEGLAFLESKDRCIECGACGKNCSVEAIDVEAGVG